MSNCATCMHGNEMNHPLTIEQRQLQGCGYLPLHPLARPWSGYHLGYRGDPATVCPGYTTSLPPVIEIAIARHWFSRGELSMFCDGERATDALKTGVNILDGAIAEMIEWRSTPKSKGGGAE